MTTVQQLHWHADDDDPDAGNFWYFEPFSPGAILPERMGWRGFYSLDASAVLGVLSLVVIIQEVVRRASMRSHSTCLRRYGKRGGSTVSSMLRSNRTI